MTFTKLIKTIKRNEWFMRKGCNTIYIFSNDGKLEYASVFWDRAAQGTDLLWNDFHAKDWVILCNVKSDLEQRRTTFEIKQQ